MRYTIPSWAPSTSSARSPPMSIAYFHTSDFFSESVELCLACLCNLPCGRTAGSLWAQPWVLWAAWKEQGCVRPLAAEACYCRTPCLLDEREGAGATGKPEIPWHPWICCRPIRDSVLWWLNTRTHRGQRPHLKSCLPVCYPCLPFASTDFFGSQAWSQSKRDSDPLFLVSQI